MTGQIILEIRSFIDNLIIRINACNLSAVFLSVWLATLIAMPDITYAMNTVNTAVHDSADKAVAFTFNHSYILRGDWEPPDVLLIVESQEWQDSLDSIVTAANNDMTPVFIVMDEDDKQYSDNVMMEEQSSNNVFLSLAHDTAWVRDYGPLQLKTKSGSVKWIDFAYSTERLNDDSIPNQLATYIGSNVEVRDYFLDGGAVISNGNGLCAITEKSLEDASVDPLYPEEFEDFRDLLGCKALAVLSALTGESTGHADIIAQFLAPDMVVVARAAQEERKLIAAELESAVKILKEISEEISQPLKVIRLPLIVEDEYFYSYINGTRLKNKYLMPSFNNVPYEVEHMAMNIMQSALPDVEMFSIPADEIVKKGGAVHCITLGLNLPGSTDKLQYWVKRNLKALSSGLILFN